METLDEKVRRYKILLDLKAELEERTKETNKAKEDLEQEICQMMVDEEKPSTIVDGFNYSLNTRTIYSKKSEEALAKLYKEEGITFFEALRDAGLGDIIVKKVDPRTLSSAVNALAEEGPVPRDLELCLSSCDKMSLSKRKASMKAVNKAKRAGNYG